MKIDMHGHFVPSSAVRAAKTGEDWHGLTLTRNEIGALMGHRNGVDFDLPDWTATIETVPNRLAQMDTMKLDQQVLSIAPRFHRYGDERVSSIAVAKDMNDDLADMIAEAPTRLRGLIHLPLQDPSAAIAELERMAAKPGIIGAAVGSNVEGAAWDAPELFPVLQAVQDLNFFMFIHPANRPFDKRTKRFHLNNLIGNPLETTFAIAALIFGGVLDRLPDIKLGFAHAGGFAAFSAGRFDAGYMARPDVRVTAAALPSEYLSRLYYDSITFSERALRYLIDVVGISQIMLGSDYPADMGTMDPVGFIEGCSSLSESEKAAILGGNLERMFGPIG